MTWLHNHSSHRDPSRASASSSCTALALLPERGSVAAAAAASMLQQTSRGWLAQYDGNLSQNFWSHQASSGARGSQERQRLPPVASQNAHRENFKKEHYATELNRITEGQHKRRTPQDDSSPSRHRSVSLEELEKEVMTGYNVQELHDLVHQIHKDHRNFKPHCQILADEAHKKHEREKHEPVKRVRKNTEQPRNPKWRVEDRLKRERELWRDTGEAPKECMNLPMMQFAVHCDNGKEEHALVDIKAIQAKCKGLSLNSAKSLLEGQRLREQAAIAKKEKALQRLNQPDFSAYAALSWEEKMDMAERRKLEGHISNVFHKVSQMRGKYPKEVPDSLVNHLNAMQHGDFNWHEEGEGVT